MILIADGLSGIQETIKKYWYEFQSCIVHAEMNLLSKVMGGNKLMNTQRRCIILKAGCILSYTTNIMANKESNKINLYDGSIKQDENN